jgi:D-glycero-D-manno-heptose 1,7-bisphosphate phosphatase
MQLLDQRTAPSGKRKQLHMRGRRQAYCYHSWVSAPANSFLPRTLHTVFLDRDGVLNRKMPEGRYVTSPSEFQPLPGMQDAIAKLNRAGLRVVVVSNQRGIALGLYNAADVDQIHASLQSDLKQRGAHVDAFYFCPHDKNQCNCRKPLAGLFEQAQAEFPEIAAESSVMIGDSWSDIEFGHRLGMLTVFLEGDPEHQKPGVEKARELADQRFPSLLAAVNSLLADLVAANPTA